MAKTGSYIKLDRGLKRNPLWLEKPFSKGQAWVDLLMLAQGVELEKHYRGHVQHQKTGTVYTSINYLSTRWGWYRTKVYRFFDTLINLEMVEIQGWSRNDTSKRSRNDTSDSTKNSTTNGTIITIVNWALYQDSSTKDDTKDDAKDDTPNDTTKCSRNDTHNIKHIRESNIRESKKNKPPKSPKGDSSPVGEGETGETENGELYDSPIGKVKRGTDRFRNVSHLILDDTEGTLDDIPVMYRDGTYQNFKTFADYKAWRNQ